MARIAQQEALEGGVAQLSNGRSLILLLASLRSRGYHGRAYAIVDRIDVGEFRGIVSNPQHLAQTAQALGFIRFKEARQLPDCIPTAVCPCC